MRKTKASPQFILESPAKEVVTVQNTRPSKEELVKIESPEVIGKKSKKKEKGPGSADVQVQKKVIKREPGTELIVTEKPQAAMKIAYALSDNVSQKRVGKISYYECLRDGKKIIVACAVGHLFSLFQKEKKIFPAFELEWRPSYTKKGSEFTKQYLDVIQQLGKRASKFTMACDYDIEGEVIGLNVMRFALNQSDANRMKFSTLTKSDIVDAYENKLNHIDWGLAYAGETRHYLDWLYGINLSRALMDAIKKAGSFAILSVGRVQGPALSLIVKKEKEIMKFKSKQYWQVSLIIRNAHEIIVRYAKDIFDKKELSEFERLKGKKGFAETKKEEEKLIPPFPFDLTTLQLEAYRLYGIAPSKLLQIAQSLYLDGLISYPRTSSQKLPATIDYDRILRRLNPELTKNVSRKVPVEGNKSDPAHPAIYPTGEGAELTGDLEKIYDLIVRRFVSCFCSDALIETKTIAVTVEATENQGFSGPQKSKISVVKKFSARGLKIKEKGWLNVYKAKIEERMLPDVNGEIKVKEVNIEEKETQPPHRYSEASLVSELAKRNLGTKATRALIIDTLYKRGYIIDKQIKATSLGINVSDVLEKYSPLILDEKLTRKFEKEMDAIQTSKKGKQEEEKILKEAEIVLTEISGQFKKNEKKIGDELLEAQKEKRQNDRIAARIMQCPRCKVGFLVIRRNKRGQQFLACDKYPECTQTFSLPPYGLVKKTDKVCECGFPVLMTIRKGKRPWEFCFNPNCPKKLEKKAEREADENK
jgi:DNA topoisomerase-1